MDRRTFLGIIPTAALTNKAMGADFAKISTSEGPIYKGYRIWGWTGWKSAQSTSVIVGQWLAAPVDARGNYVPPDMIIPGVSREERHHLRGELDHLGSSIRPLLYVSVPGGEDAYLPGWLFDCSTRRGQVMIERRTPEHIKERERRRGLKRMFRLIDRYNGGGLVKMEMEERGANKPANSEQYESHKAGTCSRCAELERQLQAVNKTYIQAKTGAYDCERLLKGVRVENRRLRKELEIYKKVVDCADLPEKICLNCGLSHDDGLCSAAPL